MHADWIIPDWKVPGHVAAVCTTRAGGISRDAWASMNLGAHCGDHEADVQSNRAFLRKFLPSDPHWLRQVHGNDVYCVGGTGNASMAEPEADAQVSMQAGQVCAVLTADCLPVLFCHRSGNRVAAAHAGWRGLAAGVLEQTVNALDCSPGEILAWLGPAIGPQAFEVGDDVRSAFLAHDPASSSAFFPSKGRWLCDLYMLARQRLLQAGVFEVSGGTYCTYTEKERFFSYRRDQQTGRMASLVWIKL